MDEEQIQAMQAENQASYNAVQSGVSSGVSSTPTHIPSDVPDVQGQLQEGLNDAQAQIQEQITEGVQNAQIQTSDAVENILTQIGAMLRGRSFDEEAEWRASEYLKMREANEAFQGQMTDPLSEGIRAASGGTMDAFESLGDFAELSGDTGKTLFNQLTGKPLDQTQNPFSSEYERGDAGWLNIPDNIVPENRTSLGKLARGFVEFGVLLGTTRGIGNTLGASKHISVVGSRSAGVGGPGSKFIQFVKAGGRVAAEGAAAELIMDDEANLMNLVKEHANFLSPTVKKVFGVNALAVHPDDNPWLAKLKTVAVGSGFNLVAHTFAAFAKGKWAAVKASKNGLDADAANEIGNRAFQDEWLQARQLDEVASTQMAADRLVNEKKGIPLNDSREDYILNKVSDLEGEEYLNPATSAERKAQIEKLADDNGVKQLDIFDFSSYESKSQALRKVDPFVNPRKFTDAERATLRPDTEDVIKKNLKESIVSDKNGGDGKSYSPLLTEAAIRQMSRGDKNIREWVEEVADDISAAAFKSLDETLSQKDVRRLIIKQAAEMHELVARDGGKGAVDRLKEHFKKGENGIEWNHDGNRVVTGNASQRIALQLLVNRLMKQASAVARGTLEIADDVPVNRQVEQIFDLTKIALIEHKKIGYMTGSELGNMKVGVLSPTKRKAIQKRLSEIESETDELFKNLSELYLRGDEGAMDALWELYALSDGNVTSMNHVHEFLRKRLTGGDMGQDPIKGEFNTQMGSTFYNSILSAFKTPIDAITSTTMIAVSRPAMQWIGAAKKLDRKEMAIAWSGMDAIGQAWAESFKMAMYNWDLGLERKNQTYMGRFDAQGDMKNWKDLGKYYNDLGTPVQRSAYKILDNIVNINSSPWMKYSANAMGAGDALARTIIGRMQMRMKATRQAIEEGVDLNDAITLARKTEQNFRKEIFKRNSDGMWVVSDKAVNLAGDETTMTKSLEGWLKVTEGLQKAPFGRIFFPFVRTGINALDLTWQHSPAGIFHKKYIDLKSGRHLDKYGLSADEIAGELAMMDGRIAVGNAIVGMATLATLNGNMTGDYPYNKVDRDLWIQRGIQPYSFKFWNPVTKKDYYVSYEELEPFNTVFSVAANLSQNAHIFGESMFDHWGEKLTFMIAAVLVDKSFLSGAKDLASLLTPQRSEGQFMKTFTKFGRSHLPYAGLLGEIGTILDANRKEASTFMELMWQRDVIWKSLLEPKYDILAKDRKGKELNYAAENPVWRIFNAYSPVAITPIEDDPVKQALVDIRYNLPDEIKHVDGMQLNSKMRSELSRQLSMGNLRRDLERIISSKVWQEDLKEFKEKGFLESQGNKLRNQSFYMPIHKAFRRAKREAWAIVLKEHPEISKHVALNRAKAALGKRGSYEKLQNLQRHGK